MEDVRGRHGHLEMGCVLLLSVCSETLDVNLGLEVLYTFFGVVRDVGQDWLHSMTARFLLLKAETCLGWWAEHLPASHVWQTYATALLGRHVFVYIVLKNPWNQPPSILAGWGDSDVFWHMGSAT